MKNPYRLNIKIEKSNRDKLQAWCRKNHQQMGWTINELVEEFLSKKEKENV